MGSILRHADTWHLLGNLLALAVFGPRVFRALGAWRCAALFLVAGTLANSAAAAAIGRPVIGASGAVAGVMAAHLVLFPTSRLAPVVMLWIALQLVFACIALDFAGVAWPAHLAGAAVGAGFVQLVGRPGKRPRAST